MFSSADQHGLYVGGNIGNANINNNENIATNAIIASGGYNVYGGEKNSDSSFKAFGGFKLNQYLALEGGYANLGEYSSSGVGTIARKAIAAEGKVKSYALFIDFIGVYPLTDSFSIFGKFGIAFTKTETSASACVLNSPFVSYLNGDHTGKISPKYGVGAHYWLTGNVALRSEFEIYKNLGGEDRSDQSDIYVGSLGLTISFP